MSSLNARRLAPLIILIAGLVALPFAPFVGEYRVYVIMMFFIYIILAQGYRLIVTAHDWQLYHVVLFGVGAYTSGLLAKYYGFPVFMAIPIGGAMAALIGMAITLPLLRTKGWGFYIATFALAELVRLTWVKVHEFTFLGYSIPFLSFGGPRGIIDVPYAPVIAGIDFSDTTPYYFLVMGVMLASMYALYRIDRSRLGDSFKAISIDPRLAESIGIRVPRHRILVAAIGGFFAGIAGALLIHRLGAVDPRVFDIITMLYLLIWVVVGGYNTFWGPVIGVVVMQAVFEFTRPLMEIRPLFFGIAVILVLVFLPGGLESLIPRARARWRRLRGAETMKTG